MLISVVLGFLRQSFCSVVVGLDLSIVIAERENIFKLRKPTLLLHCVTRCKELRYCYIKCIISCTCSSYCIVCFAWWSSYTNDTYRAFNFTAM